MKRMKVISMKTKILYWPGIGKNLDILDEFLNEIRFNNIDIDIFNEEYDVGELNPNNWDQVVNNDCDWWVGISLGASLLYYAYAFVPEEKRPSRITLINPFYSKNILSSEKGFDITKYWDFSPIDMKCFIKHCELIISSFDININPYHSLVLSSSINSDNTYLMLVNSDHTLKLNNIQKDIADILISYNRKGYNIENKDNNCNIYKQQ